MRKTSPLITATRNVDRVHTNFMRNVKDLFEKNNKLIKKQYLPSFLNKKTWSKSGNSFQINKIRY